MQLTHVLYFQQKPAPSPIHHHFPVPHRSKLQYVQGIQSLIAPLPEHPLAPLHHQANFSNRAQAFLIDTYIFMSLEYIYKVHIIDSLLGDYIRYPELSLGVQLAKYHLMKKALAAGATQTIHTKLP